MWLSSNRLILVITIIAVFFGGGCERSGRFFGKGAKEVGGFRVAGVGLKESFTRVELADKGKERAGVIQAYVELKDQFGDPLKALGQFRFEIFRYRRAGADPRGERFTEHGIQNIDLSQIEVNQKYWDSTTRSYRFKLRLPQLEPSLKQIVVQFTLTDSTGIRFEDILSIPLVK